MERYTASLPIVGEERRLERFVKVLLVAAGLFLFLSWQPVSRDDAPLKIKKVPLLPVRHTHGDPFTEYADQFPLQVAVFWTLPDLAQENPLPLIHALKEMGIPFFLTRDLSKALEHRLVILYPSVDAHAFSLDQAQELTAFVRQGGFVFAQNVFWGGLRDLFGFNDFEASRKRYHLTFAGSDPVLKYLNRPEERETRLGSNHYPEIFWSNGYSPGGSSEVLARFDDGTAALLTHPTGQGRVYLLGMSLLDLVLRSQSNRDFEAERHYSNAFEPGADVWLLILRAWYETYASDWVRMATNPGGRRSYLLLSHDVDWENSFAPGLDYARMEKVNGAISTFFIQTKYVDDANSKAFFFEPNLGILRQLKAGGSTLGSHSIIHSRGFNKFDLGSGEETYSNYHPRGLGFDTASGGTVFGEVRVSKELLDGEIPGQDTIFFRAGHLRVPRALPEALERSGYQFDSSFTADDVLSNFPYALPRELGFEEDSELYEFPVTIEDEEAPGFANRVPQALEVILANAENEAVSVVLVHSNESTQKAVAEQDLIRRLPPDIGKTDMLGFAKFWRARDRLRWSVHQLPHGCVLQVTPAEPIAGLTFSFQPSLSSGSSEAAISVDQHRLVLPDLRAGETRSFRVTFVH
jgi:hypothetical protein